MKQLAMAPDGRFTTHPKAPSVVTDAAYAVQGADGILLVDSTASAVSINLPAANAWTVPRELVVKKVAGSNSVTVAADGLDEIDGAATYDLSALYATVRILSDGSTWWVV